MSDNAHLQLDHVVKHFGGLTATNDLSFDVKHGESLGLIGPNGAGKTTIFNLIMGEYRQDSGDILYQNQSITKLPTHARILKGVTRTYQVPRPFSEMSVLENIQIGLMPNQLREMIFQGPDRQKEEEIARNVGLSEQDFNRPPTELSIGDLRKLELARALATNPSLMLLDEVFAGLTLAEIAQIAELINKKRQEGMTFIIISHDLRSLEPLIDRAIAMSFGSIVAQGTFSEVISDQHVQKTYLGDS